MFPIFKINHVINNQIKKIYIFIGNKNISREDSFATINQQLKLFSEDEFRYIQENTIEIQYINKFIHLDDTIIRIKEKIFNELTDIDISINEIYLFYMKYNTLDIILFIKS